MSFILTVPEAAATPDTIQFKIVIESEVISSRVERKEFAFILQLTSEPSSSLFDRFRKKQIYYPLASVLFSRSVGFIASLRKRLRAQYCQHCLNHLLPHSLTTKTMLSEKDFK